MPQPSTSDPPLHSSSILPSQFEDVTYAPVLLPNHGAGIGRGARLELLPDSAPTLASHVDPTMHVHAPGSVPDVARSPPGDSPPVTPTASARMARPVTPPARVASPSPGSSPTLRRPSLARRGLGARRLRRRLWRLHRLHRPGLRRLGSPPRRLPLRMPPRRRPHHRLLRLRPYLLLRVLIHAVVVALFALRSAPTALLLGWQLAWPMLWMIPLLNLAVIKPL
jgi:hypothetical protein